MNARKNEGRKQHIIEVMLDGIPFGKSMSFLLTSAGKIRSGSIAKFGGIPAFVYIVHGYSF